MPLRVRRCNFIVTAGRFNCANFSLTVSTTFCSISFLRANHSALDLRFELLGLTEAPFLFLIAAVGLGLCECVLDMVSIVDADVDGIWLMASLFSFAWQVRVCLLHQSQSKQHKIKS